VLDQLAATGHPAPLVSPGFGPVPGPEASSFTSLRGVSRRSELICFRRADSWGGSLGGGRARTVDNALLQVSVTACS
jgi:hypothetical protein